MEASISLAVAGIAFIGSVVSVYKSDKATRDVAALKAKTDKEIAEINARFNKELKDHEYRLARSKKVAEKQLEAAETLTAIAQKMLIIKPDFTSTEDDWRLTLSFATEWVAALPVSFWLPDTEIQRQYMILYARSIGLIKVLSEAPEDQKQSALDAYIEQLDVGLYNLVSAFIEDISVFYSRFGFENSTR